MKKDIESRILRITMINGDKINGQINIRRKHGHDRASDHISDKEEQFLVLMNASVNQVGSDSIIRHKTLFINKNHIIWAAPDENEN